MKLHDISLTIRPDMPVWPGDPAVAVRRVASIDQGDAANLTYLELGAHTGTHLDAPLHFIAGRRGVDQLDLDILVGPAYVAEFDVTDGIGASHLEAAGLPAGTSRLLCKTRNSRLWTSHPTEFVAGFVYLRADAARWLVEHGIGLVGVDYLSVEQFGTSGAGAPTHHILLGAEVVVVEGLNLDGIPAGRYTLACLPLKIQDADGAPCRAILIEPDREGAPQ
jgi:arylformamidase